MDFLPKIATIVFVGVGSIISRGAHAEAIITVQVDGGKIIEIDKKLLQKMKHYSFSSTAPWTCTMAEGDKKHSPTGVIFGEIVCFVDDKARFIIPHRCEDFGPNAASWELQKTAGVKIFNLQSGN